MHPLAYPPDIRRAPRNNIVCKAAVAMRPNKLEIMDIRVRPPAQHEARIRIQYTSVCRHDTYALSGKDPTIRFPCILGHEGVGIVESIGPNVTSIDRGDFVIPLRFPQCDRCKDCRHRQPGICSILERTQKMGVLPGDHPWESPRYTDWEGKMRIFHGFGTSTFSEFSVVPVIALAPITPEAKLSTVCLLGCGISAGLGAAINSADVQNGDTVAIFGLNIHGFAVAYGCRTRGAKRVIGVDVDETRFERFGKLFGITEFVNPTKIKKPIEQLLLEMTGRGCDHTFVCVAKVEVMRQALDSCHPGWGKAVLLKDLAHDNGEIATLPAKLLNGRTWTGSTFGGWRTRDDIPKLAQMHRLNDLRLGDFVTHRLTKVDEIEKAFKLLEDRNCLRCVIEIDDR